MKREGNKRKRAMVCFFNCQTFVGSNNDTGGVGPLKSPLVRFRVTAFA